MMKYFLYFLSQKGTSYSLSFLRLLMWVGILGVKMSFILLPIVALQLYFFDYNALAMAVGVFAAFLVFVGEFFKMVSSFVYEDDDFYTKVGDFGSKIIVASVVFFCGGWYFTGEIVYAVMTGVAYLAINGFMALAAVVEAIRRKLKK
jgi:hypothetical protein